MSRKIRTSLRPWEAAYARIRSACISSELAVCYTTLVKDTSLAAIINVFELTTAARQVVERTLASFEIWLAVAAMYFLIRYPISLLSQRLERRYIAEAGH